MSSPPEHVIELLQFLRDGNTQVRQLACQNLVGFSSSHPSMFKKDQLVPIKDLKLLVRDYPPIAKDAHTILINLSSIDDEILKYLAEDDDFLRSLLKKLSNSKDPNINDTAMLLANLSKHHSLSRLLKLELPPQQTKTPSSPLAINQIFDLFVTNANPTSASSYDYLSYTFVTLSGLHKSIRTHLLTAQDYDSLMPLTKILPFTEHSSHVRRIGVARTIKNLSFEVSFHPQLLSSDPDGINLLPYILLPLAGPEEYSAEETENMLPELQLLPPDKQRETDNEILVAYLETLLLLSSTRDGREGMRKAGVYPLIRECHEKVENEEVREACERVVNMLMRDEAEDQDEKEVGADGKEDEDEKIEEIF